MDSILVNSVLIRIYLEIRPIGKNEEKIENFIGIYQWSQQQ